MTRIASIVFISLTVFIGVAFADGPAADGPSYELTGVSPTVVVAVHGNGSNLTCVDAGDGLVFFDTGLSTREAARFRAEMETRFTSRTKALVLTHAHVDHFLGMGAFDDVPVWAAEAGRPRWEQYLALEWDDETVARFAAVFPKLPEEIPDARLRMPTHWFVDEVDLGSEEVPLVLRRTGGHTTDSSIALVGDGKIVIAGDLIQARRRPYFGEPDTDFTAWITAMRDWERNGATRICPGHGPVIDGPELTTIRAWFEDMAAAMGERKRAGAGFEAVLADTGFPDGYWPAEESVPRWWAYSLKRLYDFVE